MSDAVMLDRAAATRIASQPIASLPLNLTINGEARALTVEPWTTLLDLLRDKLDLTGSKKGCDHGQCGACTVLIDGKRINSCLKLAVTLDGSEVTTIEGLGQAGRSPPAAGRFHRPRRLPMRLLHAGADLLGAGAHQRRAWHAVARRCASR